MRNKSILIHHKLNETSKEIYMFEKFSSNIWAYSGIFFSNRNDEYDDWGDEWEVTRKVAKNQKFDELVKSLGYSNRNEMLDDVEYNVDLYDKYI